MTLSASRRKPSAKDTIPSRRIAETWRVYLSRSGLSSQPVDVQLGNSLVERKQRTYALKALIHPPRSLAPSHGFVRMVFAIPTRPPANVAF